MFWLILIFALTCGADIFTHKETGKILHGYLLMPDEQGKTFAQTTEKGKIGIESEQWDIVYDANGRDKNVAVLTIEGQIRYQIATDAFITGLHDTVNNGPLFILIEIDTPGGRLDLAEQMWVAISQVPVCPVIGYIKSGPHGGAISAGVPISLSCSKLFMAPDTVIGGATAYIQTEEGPKDFKEAFGETVGEKYTSIWRAKMATAAESHGRSPLLAQAMIDKDIEVIEVVKENQHFFIDPVNKQPDQKLIKTWSKKDFILTLTGAEAVQCGMANKVLDSRQAVLEHMGAPDANIIIDTHVEEAMRRFEIAQNQFDRIAQSLDFKIKEFQGRLAVPHALRILREAKSDFNKLVRLSKEFEDLPLDTEALQQELNTIETQIKQIKIESRRRKR